MPALAPASNAGATGGELVRHISTISQMYLDCWGRYQKLIAWSQLP